MTMTAEPTAPARFLPAAAGIRRDLDNHLQAIREATDLDRLRATALSLAAQAEALHAGLKASSVQVGSLRAERDTLRAELFEPDNISEAGVEVLEVVAKLRKALDDPAFPDIARTLTQSVESLLGINGHRNREIGRLYARLVELGAETVTVGAESNRG